MAVIDVGELLVVTDYFVVCTGETDRQVAAIADEIERQLKEAGLPPIGREGLEEGKWALLDFADVVVHVFQPDERDFYRLERLWDDAPRLELSPEVTNASRVEAAASDERDRVLRGLHERAFVTDTTRRYWLALALVGVAAVWGATFVMVKDAVELYPLYGFLGWRFAIAVVAFLVLFPRSLRRFAPGTLRVGLLAGTFLHRRLHLPDLGSSRTRARARRRSSQGCSW